VLSDKGSRTKFMLLGLLLASAAYALLLAEHLLDHGRKADRGSRRGCLCPILHS
jgi:hypothetical protein